VARGKAVDHKTALATLPSLGPTSAQMLIEAGIPDVKTLRRLGALGSYRRLRFHFGKRVTTNFAYAIECALRRMDWRLLEPKRKAEIKLAVQKIAAELESAAQS
jgi:DNA transformation protein and related proteins